MERWYSLKITLKMAGGGITQCKLQRTVKHDLLHMKSFYSTKQN